MDKFKIEIEIEIDFEKIFSEIPQGLFSSESTGPDEYYKKDVIYNCLKNSYLYSLDKNARNLISDVKDGLYKYLKHHNECELEVSKQLGEKTKIYLIK
jgi:hypothetical protein